MRRTFIGIAAVLALLATSCTSQGEPPAEEVGVPTISATADAPVTSGEVGTPTATAEPPPETQGPPVSLEPLPVASCREAKGWNTKDDTERMPTQVDGFNVVYNVRAGEHGCFDRVVFDLNGANPMGFHVRYVGTVREDGSGKPLPVAGGAALEVVISAPTQGCAADVSGHQPGRVFAPSGTYLLGPEGYEDWDALRGVRSAGCFEAMSTFAIGVKKQTPFAARLSVDEDAHIAHVIVDIAHS